jgi:hypothetical protein
MTWWRGVAVCCSSLVVAAACNTPPTGRACPSIVPGSYSFHLAGELIFDAGCAGPRAFDGQTVTVQLQDGSATLVTSTGSQACTPTSDGPDIYVDCVLPTGDELQLELESGLCDGPDAGVTARASLLLVHLGDASAGTLDDPACTAIYDGT